jgi:uncharacterized protein (DUF2249 family)
MVNEGARPPFLAEPGSARIVEVDVREDLRSGREPFSAIMAARRQLPPGGVLLLRTIFEPVPLYAVMARQGLAHWTEQLGPEDWAIWFYSGEPVVSGAAEQASGDEPDTGVVVLDVRGLEPPEPLLRTLQVLEQLPPGGTLVQVNERVPQFLLPQLRSRGYGWDIVEEGGAVRVFIKKES